MYKKHHSFLLSGILVLCLQALAFVSCSSDDDELSPAVTPVVADRPVVTLMMSVGGLGDNGYNDLIGTAVIHFADSAGVRLRLLSPETMDEARSMYAQWQKDNAAGDSAVLILGSSAYETLLASDGKQTAGGVNGDTRRVLLIESARSDMPSGASSLYVNRYGISYIAGAMAAALPFEVMAASSTDPIIAPAVKGALDGHEAHAVYGYGASVFYLSDSEEGYAMPDSAYRACFHTQGVRVIYPLLGGSMSGVVRYLQDYFCESFAYGMDINQNGLDINIFASVIIRIDRLISLRLRQWTSGQPWPVSEAFGLDSGYVYIDINDDVASQTIAQMSGYAKMSELYSKYMDEALSAEADNKK